MRPIYSFITYLFFPGAMAIAGFALPLSLFSTTHMGWDFWGVVVCCYALLPVLGIMALIKMGVLKDLHIYDRKKRNLSYPIAIAGAALGTLYMQYFLEAPGSLTEYCLLWSVGILAVLVLLFCINALWKKVSAHMAGCSGFLAAATVLHLWHWIPFYYVLLALLINAIVYMARRGLSAHSHIELISGFGLGFITTFAILYL
ncbi:MAG: hypothetical protein IT244_01870 [Bacteroidia bacterium]|nr:hypothetical protein [Bacteroidia bacterium]